LVRILRVAVKSRFWKRMTKTLIIAEKPSVALDISRALGGFTREGDYFESDTLVLSSSVGHLLSLIAPNDPVKGKWSFTHLPVIPPQFELNPSDKKSAERLKMLVRLIKRKDVSALINAICGSEKTSAAPLVTVDDAGRDSRRLQKFASRYPDEAS
jgi:hypothetical protein